jgi:N-methylhydantoinase B
LHADLVGGGNGAAPANDGADALNGPLGPTLNVPVEAIEAKHPYLRVDSFRLVPDSGGAGRYRGGLAVERRVTVLVDNVRLGHYRGRITRAAPGLFDGQPGALGSCVVWHQDQERALLSHDGTSLDAGDHVILTTCGGGGYGNPQERDGHLVQRDVAEGYVSSAAATEAYGVTRPVEVARAVASAGYVGD